GAGCRRAAPRAVVVIGAVVVGPVVIGAVVVVVIVVRVVVVIVFGGVGVVDDLQPGPRCEVERDVEAGGRDGGGQLPLEDGARLHHQDVDDDLGARLVQVVDHLGGERDLIGLAADD